MILQSVAEFVILLGFGTILVLLGLLLMYNPRMFWKWDKRWFKQFKNYKKQNPPATYDMRQRMGALITIGFGITLLVAAMFTVLIYSPS